MGYSVCYEKIFYSIIFLIVVYMVNDLIREKFSANMFFNDYPVEIVGMKFFPSVCNIPVLSNTPFSFFSHKSIIHNKGFMGTRNSKGTLKVEHHEQI